MLGKLVKYDLKSGSRIFCAMYVFIIICSIISRLAVLLAGGGEPEPGTGHGAVNTISFIFYILSAFMMVVCMAAICVITMVWAMLRYRNNLLRDEGYLMHTLPVVPSGLYFSKVLTTAIWFLADTAIIFIALLMSGMTASAGFGFKEFIGSIANIIHDNIMPYGAKGVLFIVLIIVFIIAAVYNIIAHIYASLNIGYAIPFGKGYSRDLIAIGAYILIYIIFQVISMLVIVLVAVQTIKGDWFTVSSEKEVFNYMLGILSAETVIIIVFSFILSSISIGLMKKKLDLE